MTIFFFPQWQGSFSGNKLYSAAKTLRTHLETVFEEKPTSFVDVEVDTASFSDVEGSIIERRAIVRQVQTARALLDRRQPNQIFILGGDCGIEVVPVGFLNVQYENDLALLWFDAHADLNTPESSPSQTFHGMPLRTLLGEGDAEIIQHLYQPLSPEQVFLLGVREVDEPEKWFIEQKNLWTVGNITDPANQATLFSMLRERGYRNLYIHFDLDVLDPVAFPYLDFPAPNGFSVEGSTRLIQSLATNFNLVGMSITEYASERGEGLDMLEPLLRLFVGMSHMAKS